MTEYENKIEWIDKKRILGMPISFTKYSLTKDRLFVNKGLLNTIEEQILLYKVRDLTLKSSLVQKIFGVGTIIIISADASNPDIHIINIRKSRSVKELLNNFVEQAKKENNIKYTEIMNSNNI